MTTTASTTCPAKEAEKEREIDPNYNFLTETFVNHIEMLTLMKTGVIFSHTAMSEKWV